MISLNLKEDTSKGKSQGLDIDQMLNITPERKQELLNSVLEATKGIKKDIVEEKGYSNNEVLRKFLILCPVNTSEELIFVTYCAAGAIITKIFDQNLPLDLLELLLG